MKKYVLSLSILTCLLTLPVIGQELKSPSPANEDMKCILEKTLLHVKAEPFLNMIAAEAIMQSGKEMDSADLIVKFKESFNDQETLSKFAGPYLALFTVEEIKELRKIHESPVFEKYSMSGGEVFQANFLTLQEKFKELADKHGASKAVEETAGNVIEVTEENFHEVVVMSKKPIVMDVYSNGCKPCRMMEPIIKDLSAQYKDSVTFVKINCDEQSDLAKKYDVTSLPTILFINPEKEDIEPTKTIGYTAKKDLDAQISEFIQSKK